MLLENGAELNVVVLERGLVLFQDFRENDNTKVHSSSALPWLFLVSEGEFLLPSIKVTKENCIKVII